MDISKFLSQVGQSQTKLSSELDEIIKRHVNDPKIAELVKNITHYCNTLIEKINNSNRPEEEKKKAIKIFKRLFRKIPSREIGGKGDIMIPLNDVRMNLYSMLYLSTFGIEIGYIQYKNLEGYSVEIIDKDKNEQNLDNRYKIKLFQEINGKNLFIKEIPSERWKSFVFTFRLLDTVIDQNYIALTQALQNIFQGETKAQWEAESKAVAKEVAAICSQSSQNLVVYGNLGSGALSKDLFPIPNKSLFDKNKFIAGKSMFNPQVETVLQMQLDGELPSIFNPESLEMINIPQIVIFPLDGSNSTNFRSAFKLLNIATSQASRHLQSILPDRIKTFIMPYTRNINGVYTSLDGYILPGIDGGGTNTHVGIRVALEFFIRYNQKIINGEEIDIAEFNEIIKMFDDYFPEEAGGSSPYLGEKNLRPTSTSSSSSILSQLFGAPGDYQDWELSSHIDTKYFDSQMFNNCHLIPVTDGLPNWRKKTVNIAKPVKQMGVGFSQLIVGYDLFDMDKTIAGEILTALGGGDEILDMPDYIYRFEEISKQAGGSSFIVWLNEALAHGIVSMFDISLGLNYLNLINNGKDA